MVFGNRYSVCISKTIVSLNKTNIAQKQNLFIYYIEVYIELDEERGLDRQLEKIQTERDREKQRETERKREIQS